MPVRLVRNDGPHLSSDEIVSSLRGEGLEPTRWGNAPGDTYGWHAHPYRKVLACLSGEIVFHTRDSGDVTLSPGDRLVIEAETEHAATVGAGGVECAEAHLDGG